MEKSEIKKLIREAPTIFEIGANDGGDTQGFLDTIPFGFVYCFEPDIRTIDKLKNKLSSYGKFILEEMAIGNENGIVDFHVSSGNPGGVHADSGDWDKSGSIKKPKNHLIQHSWCKFDTTKKVQIMKLDTYVEKNHIHFIDFVWADVQGAEEDMILGGIQTLNDKVKYLYTEVDAGEMYEGAATLERILELLPNFELVQKFDFDVLLINKKFR